MKFIKKNSWIIFLLILIQANLIPMQINSIRKKGLNKALRARNLRKTLTSNISSSTDTTSSNFLNFPALLSKIPYGEETGIVINVKKIQIDNVKMPYNASILEMDRSKYLLAFRYDRRHPEAIFVDVPFKTKIGLIELDKHLNPIQKTYSILDTSSDYSEDPRLFSLDGTPHLIFNDLSPSKVYNRTMRLAKLHPKKHTIEYATNLDLHLGKVEKNWVPFEYTQDGASYPYISYQPNPHKILKLANPQENNIEQLLFPDEPCVENLVWSKIWGDIKGGTPARKINDHEYITFFHSAFKDEKTEKQWYVMGAYTFEAAPPFRILSISKYPLLFHGIYQTPHGKYTLSHEKMVIFPAGLALDNQNGREVFHLSCGENDSGIKILTLDKKALLDSLAPISQFDDIDTTTNRIKADIYTNHVKDNYLRKIGLTK